MHQKKQLNRLASGGINYIPNRPQTILDRNPEHHETQTPVRSVQPIKLDKHEKPEKKKKSKFQRE